MEKTRPETHISCIEDRDGEREREKKDRDREKTPKCVILMHDTKHHSNDLYAEVQVRKQKR
jgi:hypothetical protein